MNKDIVRRFVQLDQQLLDLQEALCASRKTHRADQVDILRRALTEVFSMTKNEQPLPRKG